MYDYDQINDFYLRMEEIISTHDKTIAFNVITEELDNCDARYLADLMAPLNYLRETLVLDWIEKNAERPCGISQLWGQLAASSNFTWERAETWLKWGRPWSLISLDALIYCTTKGPRLNQSRWMQEIDPNLIHIPDKMIIVSALELYLGEDNVPRTRNAINIIIDNLGFQAGSY